MLNSGIYLDMPESLVFLQKEDIKNLNFQQDGKPQHFGLMLHECSVYWSLDRKEETISVTESHWQSQQQLLKC
jgi:hypothetical protein